MKKIAKLFVSLAVFSMLVAAPIGAHANTLDLWGGQRSPTASALGLGTQDVRQTIANIINIALGLLGVIAVVIVLLGGFKWMMAGGEQAKVDEAKKLITSGVIGLAIIVSAYAIAQFVIDSLMKATE